MQKRYLDSIAKVLQENQFITIIKTGSGNTAWVIFRYLTTTNCSQPLMFLLQGISAVRDFVVLPKWKLCANRDPDTTMGLP